MNRLPFQIEYGGIILYKKALKKIFLMNLFMGQLFYY